MNALQLAMREAEAKFRNGGRSHPTSKARTPYTSIELFAGCGGLALGLEQAGFQNILLNEIDRHACDTLRRNRPGWNVVHDDIRQIDFTPYQGQVDLLTGGFPCQSFSVAGKRLGFDDIRGTLFFEFARAIQECQPKVILGENVKGLLRHDNGRTLATIVGVLDEIGYAVVPPRVLKAVDYRVPQKRERLLLVGIRKDLLVDTGEFHWPEPSPGVMTMRDALRAGELYANDVPASAGLRYSPRKSAVLALVPPGGCWRNLPAEVQSDYAGTGLKGGGSTGLARRLAWNQPSLTLTCSPSQKMTERCHPDETRPLTVREYARIQTFPDAWQFCGSTASQYRQIGNAVPVNLAEAVGNSLAELLAGVTEPRSGGHRHGDTKRGAGAHRKSGKGGAV